MSKHPVPSTPTAPKQQLVIGLVAMLAGGAIVALAAGVIPASEESFRAPRWVVGLAGVVFVSIGAIFLTPLFVAGFALPDQYTAAQNRAIRLIQKIWGCLLLTSFAAVPLWIGFGPGERTFSSTVSLSGLVSHGPGNETSGRVVFGAAGILIGIWAMFTWIALFRTVIETFRRSKDDGNQAGE